MLPPPITMANSTPSAATSATSSVMRRMVVRLMPKASSPISASPESFRRTRLYDLVVVMSEDPGGNNERSLHDTAGPRAWRAAGCPGRNGESGLAGGSCNFRGEVFRAFLDALSDNVQ